MDALRPPQAQLSYKPSETMSGQGARVRFPIRAKITLPYLLLSLALAIGAAIVVTRVVFDSLEERFKNQLVDSGLLASEWMVREEDRLLETTRLLIHTEGFAEALLAGDEKKLQDLAFGIAVNNQEEAVEILDAQGMIVLSMRHKSGGLLEEYDFGTGGSAFSELPFVNSALSGLGDNQGDKYAGLVLADWGRFFYIAAPVYDMGGNVAGAVLVGKSLATLSRQMKNETLSQITLYAADGQVLASTFFEPQPLTAGEAATVLLHQDASSQRRQLVDQRDLTLSNREYSEILGPWEIRGDADLGVLGSGLPKNFLPYTSRITRVQIFTLVAFAFLFTLLLGSLLATYITRPLLGLMRASQQVAVGNLDVQVEPNSHDELAVLAASFNQMIANLKASHQDLINAYDSTLEGWSRALEMRDRETEGHTVRVAEMTVKLARSLGVSDEELVHMNRGALLHDMGKMGIPDHILLKPGKLTDDEWQIMRKHPVYAVHMLWPIEYLRPALDIPHYHHERWDGKGYPEGLAGEKIPFSARIFSVIDVWDALTSDRPYRAALSEDVVIPMLQEGSGTQFDPIVVDAFIRQLEQNRA